MTVTAAALTGTVGRQEFPSVPWGKKPALDKPGIYIVTTSPDPASVECPALRFSEARLAELLEVCEVKIDGQAATVESLQARLLALAPAGQNVLYIGRASQSVAKRVMQFARTKIGARAPHAGGWPIQMLDMNLWVHYTATDHDAAAEASAITLFADGAASAMPAAHDPDRPIPFANLHWPGHGRKRHGITGATG